MKAVIAALFVGMLLAGASVIRAEEPVNCDPEDRTVKGNANSSCQWDYHLDDITTVRYVVLEHPGANICYEALEFSPFDFGQRCRPRPLLAKDIGTSRWPTQFGELWSPENRDAQPRER